MSWNWSEVSSPLLNPGQAKPQGTEWAARLIPGAGFVGFRKKTWREAGGYAAFSAASAARFPDAGRKNSGSGLAVPLRGRPENRDDANWGRSSLGLEVGVLRWVGVLPRQWAGRGSKQRGTRAQGRMRNVLIVGAGGLGRRLANYLEEHPEMAVSLRISG